MVCRKCGAPDALRRENREGFLQFKVFPLFGLYPWECVMCRKVAMYRKHFPDRTSEESASWPPPGLARQSRHNAPVPASPARS
jgi:hypothetical protein